jgi:hypothetical protein
MLAWRLTSHKVYNDRKLAQKNETQFTTNPVLFCEMFKKFLKELEREKDVIYEWDDLLAFDTAELTTYYDHEGKEQIFKIDYRHDDDCLYVYEIETVEILI